MGRGTIIEFAQNHLPPTLERQEISFSHTSHRHAGDTGRPGICSIAAPDVAALATKRTAGNNRAVLLVPSYCSPFVSS